MEWFQAFARKWVNLYHYSTVASQLQIMSPCILLAAVSGVQMARLTSTRRLVVGMYKLNALDP
jgi:hypothetical protein